MYEYDLMHYNENARSSLWTIKIRTQSLLYTRFARQIILVFKICNQTLDAEWVWNNWCCRLFRTFIFTPRDATLNIEWQREVCNVVCDLTFLLIFRLFRKVVWCVCRFLISSSIFFFLFFVVLRKQWNCRFASSVFIFLEGAPFFGPPSLS